MRLQASLDLIQASSAILLEAVEPEHDLSEDRFNVLVCVQGRVVRGKVAECHLGKVAECHLGKVYSCMDVEVAFLAGDRRSGLGNGRPTAWTRQVRLGGRGSSWWGLGKPLHPSLDLSRATVPMYKLLKNSWFSVCEVPGPTWQCNDNLRGTAPFRVNASAPAKGMLSLLSTLWARMPGKGFAKRMTGRPGE